MWRAVVFSGLLASVGVGAEYPSPYPCNPRESDHPYYYDEFRYGCEGYRRSYGGYGGYGTYGDERDYRDPCCNPGGGCNLGNGQNYGYGYGQVFYPQYEPAYPQYQGYQPYGPGWQDYGQGYGHGPDFGPNVGYFPPRKILPTPKAPSLPPLLPPLPPQAKPVPPPAPPIPKQAPAFVRRDLRNLDLNSREIQSYLRAVQAMKNLPETDPHSWIFQANIHANECQHGNWWFLPWHRAYLHYLERIVRRYSEDPSFAFPYWNYADPAQRQLPLVFRDPKSPLFDGTRRYNVNTGEDALSEGVVVGGTQNSLANTVFADFNPGVVTFGGPALTAPQRVGRPHGAVESVPHDMVHVFVGGNFSDVDFAGRDPVFALHHANIDRLWVEWLAMGQGRANPANDVWLDQEFSFYDENKQRVSIPVRRLVDTQALGYTYERAGSPPLASRPVTTTQVEKVASFVKEKQAIGVGPVNVALQVRPGVQAVGNQGRINQVQLWLEGVRFSQRTDSAVAVFLNLPAKGPRFNFQDYHYAGCFTFFDHGYQNQRHHDGNLVSVLNITQTVEALKQQREWRDDMVHVTLVRVSPGTVPRSFQSVLTFDMLSLSTCR